MAKQKVFKTGNSLAVTISSEFAQAVGVKPGDVVDVQHQPDTGRISYTFSGAKQLPLSQNFVKKRRRKTK
mgnify:CR=1 FL=1